MDDTLHGDDALQAKALEELANLLDNAHVIYCRVKQDGRYRTLPLTEIANQVTVANFVIAQMEEFKRRSR